MADLFEQTGIAPPKDIFAVQGIAPPSIQEQNQQALSPLPVSEAPEELQADYAANQQQTDQLARARFSDQEIQAMRDKGPIGFWEATDFLEYQDVLPGGGLFQAADLYRLNNAASKMKEGKELNDSEQQLMNDFIDKHVEMNVRGLSIGGGISYYGSQVPAFMIEFAITGGLGKAAQKGVEQATKKIVKSAVTRKVAGVTANVLARTAAMPQRYAPQFAELRLNDHMSVTDKGAVIFKESKESPAKSALKAFAYTGIEVASEMSGAALGKYVVQPVVTTAGRYLKTPIATGVQQLPIALRQNLYKAYKAVNPSARVSKAFTVAGWNGMLEELGEERVADVMRATFDIATDEEYNFQNYLDAITPTSDQLMIEAGIVGIMGGVKASADIATNIITERNGGDRTSAREIVNNMSASEQEQFVDNAIAVREAPEQIAQNTDDISTEQLKAAYQQQRPQINNDESSFDHHYQNFFNRLQPIEDVAKQAKTRGAKIAPGKNPFTLSRTYAGVIGQIEHNLQYGTTKLNTDTGQFEVTGKSLKHILDDFDNSIANIETSRDAREQDFNDYLIARRTLEDLVPREDVDVSESDKVKSLDTMNRLAAKYGGEFNWFSEFAEEMYEYQRRVLSNLVDSQVISQKQFDEIVNNNPNYIPFQRVLEEEHFSGAVSSKGVFTDANAKKAIKRIQGSDKDVKFTTHSVIANTAKIVDIAYRNRVATGIADLAEIMPEYIESVATPMKKVVVTDPETGKEIETFRPSGLQPRDSIVAYIDGKRKYYKVSPALLEAMNNLSPVQMNATLRLLTEPLRVSARLLRAGATLIPEFWVRNVIRDQGTAFLQSPVRPTPIDTVKGLISVIGKNDLYQDWMRNGGAFNSYMELDDKGLQKSYRELFRPQGKFARYTRNPINILSDISNALEQATRIGAFSKAREKGIEGIEAALIAREATLDFARGGTVSQQINQYIPFFNAGVQSVDKLVRTFKENPKATALWGIATITVPSVVLTGYYLYGAPEEERKEYLEIPQWQRDMFWVFKEDGQWRRIPKPFSFGYLFGSVPERFMTWGYQGNKPEIKKFWQELATGIAGTISPVYDPSAILPPLVKVTIEDLTNYNFFTGRNIYPEWMDRFEPEQRKNKYTSEVANQLGKQLGISPALIDNSLRGQLAGSATYITDAGDAIINSVKKWNGQTIPEKPVTPSDIPLIKAFSVREPTGYNTNSVANFFDDWDKVSQIQATFNNLEGEEKRQYQEKNINAIRLYRPMKNYYDRIRQFGKGADRVWKDKTMTSEEKVKSLSDNGKLILDTATQANKWYRENK